jgi:hypothetical protein
MEHRSWHLAAGNSDAAATADHVLLKMHVFVTTLIGKLWTAVDMMCCNSLECARAARGARGLP